MDVKLRKATKEKPHQIVRKAIKAASTDQMVYGQQSPGESAAKSDFSKSKRLTRVVPDYDSWVRGEDNIFISSVADRILSHSVTSQTRLRLNPPQIQRVPFVTQKRISLRVL